MSAIQVITVNDQLVVDSRLVSEALGIEHRALIQTIKKYQATIESAFGAITFEMREFQTSQGNTCTETFAYLNENQALLLMTFSRNTEQVVQCKVSLVQAFSDAKTALAKFSMPQTYLEALKALVTKEEEKELLELQNQLLEQTNLALSEAVDELFDYSSIIRVAKFNNISEKSFSWHRLKAATMKLGLETKKVPSPRFGYQLLYPHTAWRLAYPGVALPETTTLVVQPLFS